MVRIDGNPEAEHWLLLGHGSGAGMDHPFMATMAGAIAGDDLCVVRYEFPYMQTIRATNRRRPPDRMPRLLEALDQLVAQYRRHDRILAVGGKSLGGRVSATWAMDHPVDGVIALGYPFHPVGKPDNWRLEPLTLGQAPTLVLQGERDSFGNRSELEAITLPAHVCLDYVTDGDHGFKPRKASGVTEEVNLQRAAATCRAFILGLKR
ncbi:alpha/beta hydrolase [Ferrimonas sediminicola]|uniref:Alpha/beta hydrolase n=1 Tax=Ferrimonas sediminicola TaxID=2569538 RepID=A0A4U1BF02_9GAMM|nr:alpha/beta family hydrolase [Ferrimonas sediminicola]TKB49458.1 alpha/beta hydrolase [Ferrimonas sediminicola]